MKRHSRQSSRLPEIDAPHSAHLLAPALPLPSSLLAVTCGGVSPAGEAEL